MQKEKIVKAVRRLLDYFYGLSVWFGLCITSHWAIEGYIGYCGSDVPDWYRTIQSWWVADGAMVLLIVILSIRIIKAIFQMVLRANHKCLYQRTSPFHLPILSGTVLFGEMAQRMRWIVYDEEFILFIFAIAIGMSFVMDFADEKNSHLFSAAEKSYTKHVVGNVIYVRRFKRK